MDRTSSLDAAAERSDWSAIAAQLPAEPGMSDAAALLGDALDAEGRVFDHDALGGALHEMGCVMREAGRYREAVRWFEMAAWATAQGDPGGRVDLDGVACAHDEAGACHGELGDLGSALRSYEAAVSIGEQVHRDGVEDASGLVASLVSLGGCHLDAGDPARALECFRRASAIEPENAEPLRQIGVCLSGLRRYEEGLRVLLSAAGKAGGEALHGDCIHQAGYCAFKLGRLEEAESLFEEAVALRRIAGAPGALARSVQALGICRGLMGRMASG